MKLHEKLFKNEALFNEIMSLLLDLVKTGTQESAGMRIIFTSPQKEKRQLFVMNNAINIRCSFDDKKNYSFLEVVICPEGRSGHSPVEITGWDALPVAFTTELYTRPLTRVAQKLIDEFFPPEFK